MTLQQLIPRHSNLMLYSMLNDARSRVLRFSNKPSCPQNQRQSGMASSSSSSVDGHHVSGEEAEDPLASSLNKPLTGALTAF
jgi:hypothetical protein